MKQFKHTQRLIFSIFVAVGMMLVGGKVFADTDIIEVICYDGAPDPVNNCEVLPDHNVPLFNELDFPNYDLKPGDEINKNIKVTNNRLETCYFTLTDAYSTEDTEVLPGQHFSDELKTIITDGTSGTLMSFSDLFDLSSIPEFLYITTLAPGETRMLDWNVYFDKNAGNEYQNARLVFDFDWYFSCGKEPPQPELFIFKTNNKLPPTVQEPGADVTYTIEVSTGDFPVFNVIVLDLPPGGFEYRPGTWTAGSTVPRGPGNEISLTSPYSSPGMWDLGDMEAGETVTLTYITDIDNNQQPGTYKDIAWTEGTSANDPSSTRVLGVSTVDNTTFFVGTAAIVEQEEPTEVQVEAEEEIIEITEGEVLGAYLPATGADNVWMFIIVNLLGAGLIFTLTGLYLKRKKAVMQVLVLFAVGVLFSSQAFAANLIIRLEEPKDPNNLNSLDLNFVTLDTEDRAVTVKCYKKGPGDAAYVKFGPDIVTITGGDTGYCPVTSSIISSMGEYKFKATAEALGEPIQESQVVTIEHDDQRPGKPKDLDKDSNGSCKYDVSFTTDDDGGDTVRAEVYRSDDEEFYVNSSSRIKDITVGSDTDVEFTDNRPTCGETYYYAVRAFDAAGNGSKVLVEELEKEVTVIITEEEPVVEETVFGEIIGAVAIGEEGTAAEGEEAEEIITDEEFEEEEEVLGAEEVAEEEAEGLLSSLMRIFQWPVIILLVLLIFLYVRKKLNKKQEGPQQY